MGWIEDFFGGGSKETFAQREAKRDKAELERYRELDKRRRSTTPTKGKRDKTGAHQFEYFGVSPDEFMRAMTSGKYQGKKISRAGSMITEQGFMTHYTLARPIPKSERYVR